MTAKGARQIARRIVLESASQAAEWERLEKSHYTAAATSQLIPEETFRTLIRMYWELLGSRPEMRALVQCYFRINQSECYGIMRIASELRRDEAAIKELKKLMFKELWQLKSIRGL